MSTSGAAAVRRLGAAGHLAGLGLALAAAILWGINGVAAQALFQQHGVDPRWLVAMRMVASLRRITPTESAVTSSVEPAVAALTAFVFIGLTLQPLQYAGCALILSAVVLLARAVQRTA